ncbi:MAG: asparagine synthase (glutamine-hydrolyzing) [Acidobacteriota bacterium]
MCGIAGVIGHRNAVELTQAMTLALAHRGPDGSGIQPVTTASGCPGALGHRRLAILDLSDRGSQPMTSQNGRWTIVFNGEIFNYRELRDELDREAGRIAWRSETDTEVLLEAVAAWGPERTFRRCVGMFALALWDHRERVLTLGRDRVGEKPLVYFHNGVTFAFASELKALATLHDSRLDPTAVQLYLALGYIPAPHAIFVNTHKLAAGHLLRFANGRLVIERWWFPELSTDVSSATHEQKLIEVRALVGDAVEQRLRADVPVALALSGGIDSSVIACEVAQRGVKTDAFTVVFDQDESDLPFAKRIAAEFGLHHEGLRADGTSTGLPSRIGAAVGQFDEPFADSSSIPSLELAHALGGSYKVILNGDGGDEAFAGYKHYEFIAAKQAVKAMAAVVGLRDGRGSATVYEQSKTTFRETERSRLLAMCDTKYQTDVVDQYLASDRFLQSRPSGSLKRAMWSDRHLYLANDLTHKMDMALSAYGVEGRAPLLDHRILEWSQSLNDRDLVRGREKKLILRQAYAKELPREVVNRPKHGFGAPISSWLAGPLLGRVRDLLPCPLLDKKLQNTVLEQKPGQRLWALFMFAVWAERWGARW